MLTQKELRQFPWLMVSLRSQTWVFSHHPPQNKTLIWVCSNLTHPSYQSLTSFLLPQMSRKQASAKSQALHQQSLSAVGSVTGFSWFFAADLNISKKMTAQLTPCTFHPSINSQLASLWDFLLCVFSLAFSNLQMVCIISPYKENNIAEAEGCSLNLLDLAKVSFGIWTKRGFIYIQSYLSWAPKIYVIPDKENVSDFRKYGASLQLGVVENTGSSHQFNIRAKLPFFQQCFYRIWNELCREQGKTVIQFLESDWVGDRLAG